MCKVVIGGEGKGVERKKRGKTWGEREGWQQERWGGSVE